MFSSIGWLEIAFVIVIGVIIIGPERLPGVIEDLRAAIFAARKAINNAKAELNGEIGSLGEEFDSLRGPLSQAAEWGRMGPRGVITKALFDGDDSAWDDFNPKKILSEDTPTQNPQGSSTQPAQSPGFDYSQVFREVAPPIPGESPEPQPEPETKNQNPPAAGGFSFTDVT